MTSPRTDSKYVRMFFFTRRCTNVVTNLMIHVHQFVIGISG